MCFSQQADIAATAVVGAIAVPCLLSIRHRRELLFGLLPLIFAAHQFIEVFVWRALDGPAAQTAGPAAYLYVLIALPLLPAYVPVAVLLLEPPELRSRMLPFVALGLVVAAYFLYAVAAHGVVATMKPHAVDYEVHLRAGTTWVALYVVATVGPPLLSGFRSVIAFGAFNLVGLLAVALAYSQAFASIWCLYAACLSGFIYVHLRRRHRLLDPQGRPCPGHPMSRRPIRHMRPA